MRYFTADDLEAREQELDAEIEITRAEMAVAQANGDTDVAEQYMQELADLEKELDEVMNRWGTLDRYGYDPAQGEGYYPSALDIAQGWF